MTQWPKILLISGIEMRIKVVYAENVPEQVIAGIPGCPLANNVLNTEQFTSVHFLTIMIYKQMFTGKLNSNR